MNEIDILEKELVAVAGPLAKFVIKKQMKDMGFDRDDFPPEKISELVDLSVKNAVFDRSKQRSIARDIKRKIKANGNL